MPKLALVLATWLALVAAGVCGCNQQSNGQPGFAVVGATAAPLLTPQGPFPRGQATAASAPAREGPEITVVRPARGAQVTTASVDVEVEVVDVDGVQAVTIQGSPATDLGGGRYGATVALPEGMTLVGIEATDGLGDRSRGQLSVVRGQFVASGGFVDAAAQARLDQDALDVAAREIEARSATLDLHGLIPRPLLDTALVTADATAISHAPLRVVGLTASAGTVTAILELDQVVVDLNLRLLGNGRVLALADRVRAVAQATLRQPSGAATGAKLMGLDIDQLDVTFVGLRLQPQSGLTVAVLSPVANLLMFALRGAISSALERAITNTLSRPMAGADTPLRVNVPVLGGTTTPLELLLRVDGGRGWTGTGLDLVGSVSVTAVQPYPHAQPAGVLVTHPTPPGGAWAANDDVSVALSADAANAFAHAYWLAGAARYAIDGTAPAKSPPAARVLYPFFPLVRDLAPDPATPIVIDVSLEAPPTVRLGQPAGTMALLVPEAQVSVSLDYMDGGPRAEVLRARVSLEVAIDIAVIGDELVMSNLVCAGVAVDVIAEPSGALDDQAVEDFVLQAMPTLLGSVSQRLPRIPVPGLPAGVTLVAPSAEAVDGHLIVRASVR